MGDSIFFYIGLYIVVVILPTVIVISKAARSKKQQAQAKAVKKQEQVKAKKIKFEEIFDVKRLQEEVARNTKQPQVKFEKIDFEKLFGENKAQEEEDATIESSGFFPNYSEYSMDNSQVQEEIAREGTRAITTNIEKVEQLQTQEVSAVSGLSLSKIELSEPQKLVLYSEIMNRKYD